jgi:hypothetical protein
MHTVKAGAVTLATMTLLALTACGPTTVAAPSTPATTVPTPTPTVQTTNLLGGGGPTSTADSGGGSNTGGIGRCTVDKLKVTAVDGGAGSGHRAVVLLFTNTSGSPCRLYGYPGVAALDSHGAQVAQARRTLSGYLGGTTQPAANVDIASGQSASAMVEASAAGSDGSSCVAYPAILVTPPDETRSIKLAWPGDGCSDLQIHPVVPGTTGSQR